MISIDQALNTYIEDYLRSKERSFIDEALSAWDEVEGYAGAFPVFLSVYINNKWAEWLAGCGRN